MIIITPSISSDGDTIITTNPYSWMTAGTFTQLDVNAGYIKVQPALITNVLSSRLATINVQAQDPTANLVNTNVKVTVAWQFCPVGSTASPQIRTSDSTTPVVIAAASLNITEPHGMSIWDIEWKVSALTGGKLEWYCPDSRCAGPGWKTLVLPATIQQSWIIMNSLRWSPPLESASGSSYTVQFVSTDSYPAGKLAMTLQLGILSGTTVDTPALAYAGSAASCSIITLGNYGIKSGGFLPFGPFAVQSPIRPVCYQLVTGPSGVTSGDFKISSALANTTVTLNGAVIIDDVVFPTGFKVMNFTGSSSTAGQMFQALQIISSPSSSLNPLTISLPQTTLETAAYVKGLTTISVLHYNAVSGQLSHITPQDWIQAANAAPLLQLTVTLPTDGIYIFGYMDMAAGNVVPVASDVWVSYLKDYGAMSVQVDRSPLYLDFVASASTQFAVMKPAALTWSPDGYTILDNFYINGTYGADHSIGANMTLKYVYNSETMLWGKQESSPDYAVGYSYSIANATLQTQNTTNILKLTTEAQGQWCLLVKTDYVSASSSSISLSPSYSIILLFSLLPLLC
ncbi:hypothetical protein HDU91_004826 [Kappamyces sp. JEL0680]|nr:hypothetical protein HDU91_004826 [Kappamyces sp. JEL0680]